MNRLPTAFNIMLRRTGAVAYVAAGRRVLEAAPAPGSAVELVLDGRALRGTVDEVFIPPGCEEHCIGTLFVSAG